MVLGGKHPMQEGRLLLVGCFQAYKSLLSKGLTRILLTYLIAILYIYRKEKNLYIRNKEAVGRSQTVGQGSGCLTGGHGYGSNR